MELLAQQGGWGGTTYVRLLQRNGNGWLWYWTMSVETARHDNEICFIAAPCALLRHWMLLGRRWLQYAETQARGGLGWLRDLGGSYGVY